ncbi:MAG: phosphatase PAP2 family protein [Myxococcota bacterium]
MNAEAGPERRSADGGPSSRADQRRTQALMLGGLLVYTVVTQLTMGLRAEHGVLLAVIVAVTLRGGKALTFLALFSPVILTGITYDNVRLLVDLRGEIHVDDLYAAELALFGIDGMVPALWFETRTHPLADFIAGIAYIVYLYVPMLTAVALFWIDRRAMLLVGASFLATNLLGIAVYLGYPAAPPWYVDMYGLGPANLAAVPNAAGAVRFDQLVGVDYFTEFYKRSANVFGAMPSLHTAYPTSTALALYSTGKKGWRPVALFSLLVGFSAVYLQHHYILDVIAGFACAIAGWLMARGVMRARERRPTLEPANA